MVSLTAAAVLTWIGVVEPVVETAPSRSASHGSESVTRSTAAEACANTDGPTAKGDRMRVCTGARRTIDQRPVVAKAVAAMAIGVRDA